MTTGSLSAISLSDHSFLQSCTCSQCCNRIRKIDSLTLLDFIWSYGHGHGGRRFWFLDAREGGRRETNHERNQAGLCSTTRDEVLETELFSLFCKRVSNILPVAGLLNGDRSARIQVPGSWPAPSLLARHLFTASTRARKLMLRRVF